MNICGMYFSATNTTETVVTTITNELSNYLGCHKEYYSFTLPKDRENIKEFSPEDIVVFGTPVIAGRVPNVLLKYIRSLRGNGAKAIPVVLYGNRSYDDALIELRNLLEEDGFHTVAAAAFVGEHSFSSTLAKGRPDAEDLNSAVHFARQIGEKLLKGDFHSSIEVKGNPNPSVYYQPRDKEGNPINILKVKPKTNSSCIDCKLCAEICPMGSIDFDNVKEVQGICIKCCSCVKKCPVGAKYFDDPGFITHKEDLEEKYTDKRGEVEIFL
ncbi:MAG: EFR1 family ferrodoxin [Clostridiaceae bacterium]